jgi:hypothetical protein
LVRQGVYWESRGMALIQGVEKRSSQSPVGAGRQTSTASTNHHPAPPHLADVYVVALVLKRRRHQRDAHARADARQLAAHAVGRLEGALVQEVVVGPLRVLSVGLPRVVDVEEGEVVAWGVGLVGFGWGGVSWVWLGWVGWVGALGLVD